MNSLAASRPAENDNATFAHRSNIVKFTPTDTASVPRPRHLFVNEAFEQVADYLRGVTPGVSPVSPSEIVTSLENQSYPERWFRKVRKFTVRDVTDPGSGKDATVVKIYYQTRWKRRRKVKFVQEDPLNVLVRACERHPKAQALIEKLKHTTGHSLSRARE